MRAKIGPLAAEAVIGFNEIGGIIIQLRVAPQVTAAKQRIAVGAVNNNLSLLILSKGGC